jgi:hypothetical protein
MNDLMNNFYEGELYMVDVLNYDKRGVINGKKLK